MKSTKGFTFVELIIVIAILAVLFSIGFIGFIGHLVGTRDANRLSQITSLNDGLRLFGLKNQLPLPESHVQLTLSGKTIAYQGYIGIKILGLINFKEGGKDPKDKKYYSYYITKNRRYFQILAFLENKNNLLNESSVDLINNTYAKNINYTDRYIIVYGDKLGILREANTNKPIQEVKSIMSVGYLDIGLTNDNYISTLANNDFITGTNLILNKLGEVASFGGKGCTAKTGIISCTGKAGVGTLVGGGGGGTGIGGGGVIANFKIEAYNGGRRWTDGNLATSCNKYKNPNTGYSYTGNIGNGVYWIEPVIGTSIKVYCDMTIDNGGWTLLFNRKVNSDNKEACGTNLNNFLQNTCGNVDNISSIDSYSIGRPNRLLISQKEYLVTQYLTGVIDNDDAYIIRYSGDLFPDSISGTNNILVNRVCDINSSNCDTSEVYWKYIGNSFYAGANCAESYSLLNNFYGGNYGLCHNGVTTTYYSSSYIGNRDQYNETKSWGEGVLGNSSNYQERIFIR